TDTGSHSQSFGDNVKIDTNITDSGLAFNYINGTGALDGSNNQNGSAISPYVYFDGNFTFSWEYKVTDVQALGGHNTSNADGYRSMLELKDYTIGYDIVQLGMGSNSSNKTAASKFEMNVKGYDGKNGYKVYGEPSTNDAGVSGLNSITTIGTTIRFSMTRVLQEKHAIYILSATVLDTNGAPTEKTYTRMVIFGDATMKSDKYAEAQEKWAEPVLPYWRNSGFSGQFTNVQWQLLPNDIDVSAVAETTESTDVTLNNNAFTITLDNLITTNATFNLSETLTAGEYTVKIIALGDNTLGSSASKDLQELVVYEKEISLDAGAQYLKLDGITLGHGTYQIQIIPKAE
ncbi:MAG: hypothetical protein K2M64_00925, partial [Clostridia bacterium]|nr:hypothetical protein [Clostridia bacterium]